MSNPGGSSQISQTYGGSSKIVGNNVGGTNGARTLFPSVGSTIKTGNLNPNVYHSLFMDIAGPTDVTLELTRANVERQDMSQATYANLGVKHLTADNNYLGTIEPGHTGYRLTVLRTASATDDAAKTTALGARAVLTINDTTQPRDAGGNFITPVYTGAVITSDEEAPVYS